MLRGNCMSQKIYYVYVYLNPLKKGNFSFLENCIGISFDYEPFYIGRGKNNRYLDHIKESKKHSDFKKDGKNKR